LKDNRHDTTVIAVLLEDGVALLGILLTLLVAGVGYVYGPRQSFDAIVAIVVGAMLGVMALFLAAINRRILIDTSDRAIDRAAQAWLAEQRIAASVHSLVFDSDSAVVFVRVTHEVAESFAVGEALKRHLKASLDKTANAVYWQFPVTRPSPA
jgi:zinc transporter 9